jgi:hypothetical protein
VSDFVLFIIKTVIKQARETLCFFAQIKFGGDEETAFIDCICSFTFQDYFGFLKAKG